MRSAPTILVLLLSVALAASASGQMQQTLPVGLDAIDGDSSTSFPYGGTATHIWHWIYDTSNFNATYPILINQISIRPNGGSTSAGGTYQNVEITLASATIDWSGGSSGVQTFSANMGTDAAVVYTGPVTIPAGAQPTPANWIAIPITPFLYDPTLGNDLIIQTRTPGPGNVNAMATDGHNNGNATRYGHTSNPNSLVSNFNNPAFVPVVKIDYNPATGTYPSFTASPNTGQAPLNVAFTDTTFTSDPGGILTWAWDFDNDMVIDSTAQNPSFTYLSPGSQTVTLTVTDATFGTTVTTFPNAITVDQYTFSVATTGGGVGDITITPIPLLGAPTSSSGYTLVSFLATGPLGGGPVFGIYPDAFMWSILWLPPSVGNPLHYLVAPGSYPDVPLIAPAPAMAGFAGQTMDFVQIAVDPAFNLVLVSNVSRATF